MPSALEHIRGSLPLEAEVAVLPVVGELSRQAGDGGDVVGPDEADGEQVARGAHPPREQPPALLDGALDDPALDLEGAGRGAS
jgi:hypothetical protein